MHLRIDNTPCPCILWSLSGRDPADYHNAVKKNEAEKATQIVDIVDNECPFCDFGAKTPAGLDKHLQAKHVRKQ
jgi:hypothetical protein